MEDRTRQVGEYLSGISSSETVQSAVKAGIGLIPIVGGPISSVIGDVLSKRRFDDLMRLIEELKKRVSGIESELDSEYVKRDEFISLFERAAKEYVSTPDEVKKDYLVGLVVNSMKGPDDYYERDYFLRKVLEFSAVQLELLRLYHGPKLAFEAKGLDTEKVRGMGYTQVVTTYLPGTNLDVIRAAHKDLYNLGFINTDSNVFGMMMGVTGFEALAGRVTPVGTKFVRICLVTSS